MMTPLRGLVVSLLFSWATSFWIRVGGQGQNQSFVPPNGRMAEGLALEVFFNSTLPGSQFTKDFNPNNTCDWNETLIVCDDLHSQVLKLNFSAMGLTGPIPDGTISNLTGLTHLDLSNNDLFGNLPNVSQLTNLTDMLLSGNHFNGGISSSFPANLVNLDLSNNNLTGLIPPSSLANLNALISLKLGRNKLSGTIDVTPFTNRPSFQVLDLSENTLAGTLPTSVKANLSVLDLHGNQFVGNVTLLIDSLKALGSPNLTLLDLSSNSFDLQKFPSDFRLFTILGTLGLGGNKFLSHLFPTLPTANLTTLKLSGTNLSGSISDSICNAVKLRVLDLSNNHLDHGLPLRMGALYNLEELDLSSNDLSGQFPPNFDNMTFLSQFNVSFNNLSGPIPELNQFSTFPNTSFLGNPGLCGLQITKCSSAPGSSPTSNTTGSNSSTNTGAIIGGVVAGVVVIIVVVAALLAWCRVSRAVKPLAKDDRHVSGPMQYEKDAETWATGVCNPGGITVVMFEKPLLNLTFADLLQATGNFSKEMQIADGGYGPVYKGGLPDGTQLAIKVLVEVGFPDEQKAIARIESLAKVKHPNLVSLIGYCLVGEDTLLIYEYMVNGDLQRWLHELPEGTVNPEDWSADTWEHVDGVEVSGDYLNWPTRHKIALGTARALAFLHHGCSPHIIHRDVKTSNILLDESFEAHLVDSGLAGIARMNGTPIIGGTLGYVPPEYGQTWQATTRGDVYSFGVVLLELVTGRKPTGHYFHDSYGGNLVGWVRSMIKQDKRGQKALDLKLVSRGYVPEMLEVLRIGYLCTAETPAKRPTMQQVVGLLKDFQCGAMG